MGGNSASLPIQPVTVDVGAADAGSNPEWRPLGSRILSATLRARHVPLAVGWENPTDKRITECWRCPKGVVLRLVLPTEWEVSCDQVRQLLA